MRPTLRFKILLLVAAALFASVAAGAVVVAIQPGGVQPTIRPYVQVYPVPWGLRKFDMLAYDTLNPTAAVVQYSYTNPKREVTETEVDNEAEFDQLLYAIPDGVTLITDTSYLSQRHWDFVSLAASDDILITAAVYGDLNTLRSFALYTLGIPEIAQELNYSGTTDGMLVVQYLKSWNTAYLLGDDTYTKGLRATYPSEFPIARPATSHGTLEGYKAGPGTTILINLIKAALEEPFWNDVHYMSGKTLGKLGLDFDTAFTILYQWEMFEQWINDLGDSLGYNWEVGEDIWGIIWDLIWGMTGYLDGVLS